MNPNGQNQLWSRWTFVVRECGKHVPRKDVEYNVAKWLRIGFGSVGSVRVRRRGLEWVIDFIAEGKPAHDPQYVAHVRREFEQRFVANGWGMGALGTVSARVIAGSLQDGRPSEQWVGIPAIVE